MPSSSPTKDREQVKKLLKSQTCARGTCGVAVIVERNSEL